MLSSIIQVALLTAALASAQDLLETLSFGHKPSISENQFSVPGWSMLGEGFVPQVMSNKVILTPPWGGSKRGAMWTQASNSNKDWAATLQFRAGGVDNGKGNLQLWYVKDGEKAVVTSSIYTVGKFDGLAIVVDTSAGIQKIRGFLNDGTKDHKNYQNVDSLAFGHCDYNYRNLGRPSQLEVKSTSSGLEVLIDGKQCFNTNKISLPAGYHYGITAASNDPPDSFEAFKFEVHSVSSSTKEAVPKTDEKEASKQVPIVGSDKPKKFLTSEAQFEDLNARFNQLSKAISNMFTEINQHTKAEEQRYQEILRQISSGSSLGGLESRLSNLDRLLTDVNNELKGGNHKEQFAKLSAQLQETHTGLTQHLPGKMRDYVQNHTPRIGFIVFSFMAFQSCCLAILMWQKWRKSGMPKKFL